jgi:hypothetical protein
MNEIINSSGDCLQISHTEDSGMIRVREILLSREGRRYAVSVTTPDYLRTIKQGNQSLEADLRADENILTLEDISDPDDICKRLHALPLSALRSFLVEQSDTE